MRPTPSDGIVLIYNYAVVLSGGWMVSQLDLASGLLGLEGKWLLLVLAIPLAIGWTVYFRFGMASRLLERMAHEREE